MLLRCVSVVIGQEPEGGGAGVMGIVLTIIGGGLLLSAVAVGILLLISSSHITMPAKCSPLEDPVYESRIRDKTGECFEFDTDVRVDAELKKKDKRCDKQEPDVFRSYVRVEGETQDFFATEDPNILLLTLSLTYLASTHVGQN